MRGDARGLGVIYTDIPMHQADKREVYALVFAHTEVEYLRGEAALAADKLRAYKKAGDTVDKSRGMLIEAVRYQTFKEMLERLGAWTNQIEDWK